MCLYYEVISLLIHFLYLPFNVSVLHVYVELNPNFIMFICADKMPHTADDAVPASDSDHVPPSFSNEQTNKSKGIF